MKKWKRFSIVAAACVMTGAAVVFAPEITRFFQMLTGTPAADSVLVDGSSYRFRKTANSTADGQAYYLEEPLILEGWGELRGALSVANRLELVLDLGEGEFPDVKAVVGGGLVVEPGGYAAVPDGMELSFYGTGTVEEFDLLVEGKRFPVSLTAEALESGE